MKAFEKDVLKRVFKPLRARFEGVCESRFEKARVLKASVFKRVFKPLSVRFECVCESL